MMMMIVWFGCGIYISVFWILMFSDLAPMAAGLLDLEVFDKWHVDEDDREDCVCAAGWCTSMGGDEDRHDIDGDVPVVIMDVGWCCCCCCCCCDWCNGDVDRLSTTGDEASGDGDGDVVEVIMAVDILHDEPEFVAVVVVVLLVFMDILLLLLLLLFTLLLFILLVSLMLLLLFVLLLFKLDSGVDSFVVVVIVLAVAVLLLSRAVDGGSGGAGGGGVRCSRGFQSALTNEKSRNSSWFIALMISGSIGVSTGSSDVKSLSKLLISLSSFCIIEQKHRHLF